MGTDIKRDLKNRILTISQESSIMVVLRDFDMSEAHPKHSLDCGSCPSEAL